MRTVINDKGIIQEKNGSVLDIEVPTTSESAVGLSPVTLTSSGSITRGGMYYLSSSTGAAHLTIGLPLASSVPGHLFIFRAISTGSHIISASAETAHINVNPIVSLQTGSSADHLGTGTKVVMNSLYGITGSSVAMICDGQNFLVLNSSGSITVSRTQYTWEH